MTRYVAFGDGHKFPTNPESARFRWDGANECHVYELGREVKEPDYGPLVAWHRRQSTAKEIRFQHHGFDPSGSGCLVNADGTGCTCGLADALKAAQIE
ncbi:hypothetical protein LCGC14_0587810 [marine sediment metagenome]|uniref:Uncharacterized protein n=1 Tax=marine sediment metagenome TaxID=412755 RepID=A0A0F9UMQ0_9ZZZZ